MREELERLAELLKRQNAINQEISRAIGRPALQGHLGEFVASRIFDIELEQSATNRGYDGRFRSGPLAGRTVDVKCYGTREGLLDLREQDPPDSYLVLTGPSASATSSRGRTRPWVIDGVYLFQARALLGALQKRGVKIGVATSVARVYWDAAKVFPEARNPSFVLSPAQREALELFGSRNVGV